jgi:hypothetical protein
MVFQTVSSCLGPCPAVRVTALSVSLSDMELTGPPNEANSNGTAAILRRLNEDASTTSQVLNGNATMASSLRSIAFPSQMHNNSGAFQCRNYRRISGLQLPQIYSKGTPKCSVRWELWTALMGSSCSASSLVRVVRMCEGCDRRFLFI